MSIRPIAGFGALSVLAAGGTDMDRPYYGYSQGYAPAPGYGYYPPAPYGSRYGCSVHRRFGRRAEATFSASIPQATIP